MTTAKDLDASDLDLLRDLVDFCEEFHRGYAPKELAAWQPLLDAGMVASVGEPPSLDPTPAGRSLVRRGRAKGEILPAS